jgi:hypothetical protein
MAKYGLAQYVDAVICRILSISTSSSLILKTTYRCADGGDAVLPPFDSGNICRPRCIVEDVSASTQSQLVTKQLTVSIPQLTRQCSS